MRTVRTVKEVREALAPERHAGRSIGLVPTMGAFHGGHLSLIRRAREQCDVVVIWLFVNPTQFGPGEDLETYPRDEAGDAELAEREGVDLLFAPSPEEVYPEGFATTVTVAGLTDVLDGAPGRRARRVRGRRLRGRGLHPRGARLRRPPRPGARHDPLRDR